MKWNLTAQTDVDFRQTGGCGSHGPAPSFKPLAGALFVPIPLPGRFAGPQFEFLD